MKNKNMKKLFLALLAGYFLFPNIVGAQYSPPEPTVTDPDQFIVLLESVLGYIWAILAILVVIMLLFAGFKFLTAQGDETKVKEAKQMVMWSLVGIVVMVLAAGVMQLIQNFIQRGAGG